MLILILLFVYSSKKLRLLSKIIPKEGSFVSSVSCNWEDFKKEFANISYLSYFYITMISLLGWLLYYIVFFLLAFAISLDISFINIVYLSSISSFVAIVPITFLGIGTRDVVLIYMFNRIGLSSEHAVAFSTMFLLVYFFTFLISSVFYFMNTNSAKNLISIRRDT
ncbi:hypothetical protein MCHI_003407 [Candidatus Magnetoovum chiemensis]|nr:hypothetical protein MCHI_003407 [Candidatus Magnetoovum chiemensis]